MLRASSTNRKYLQTGDLIQGYRTMPDVFVVALHSLVFAWNRGEVLDGPADCLNTGLLVVADRDDVRTALFVVSLLLVRPFDKFIDVQHLPHLVLKLRITFLQIVGNLMRLHLVLVQDRPQLRAGNPWRRGMAVLGGVRPDMLPQLGDRPELCGQIQVLRFIGLK